MKSEISKTGEKAARFPKLMISTDDQEVVLFTSEREGIVVAKNEGSSHRIGSFYTLWLMEYFKDFHGSVTISSED